MTEMTVIEHGDGGGPEVLTAATQPMPQVGPGHVLIKVAASGVNGPDLKQRKGNYPPPKDASPLIGLEVSGHVAAVGEGVTGWAEGDEVCALVNGGGYSEYCLAPAGQCLPIPEGVSLQDAAGLPETFFTVWSNVWHGHDVPAGQTLLVHGGGGGIGSTAVQLGKAMGLTVLTTAGSGVSRALAAKMGADRVINYREEDFVAVAKEMGGADIIVDFMGGPYVQKNFSAARMDCRIIQLAFDLGAKVEVGLGPIMMKRLRVTGATLRPRPPSFKAAVAAGLRERAWPLFAQGKLQPVTTRTFPLAHAAAAHAAMEAPGHSGKILLIP